VVVSSELLFDDEVQHQRVWDSDEEHVNGQNYTTEGLVVHAHEPTNMHVKRGR